MPSHSTADAPKIDRRPKHLAPLAWVLEDDKLGHTTQSLGLANALEWRYERKSLRFNALNRLSNGVLGASLLSLDRRRSAPLVPPWPDLVIATGRRTAPIARWIRQQGHKRIRLVQLGRKGADRAENFDLSVTCSHFGLRPHPRRIETRLPLTTIDEHALRRMRERWGTLFGSRPRPHVALMVGGTSALHTLDEGTAARMGREVAKQVRAAGGSLFVVTSPRTGPSASAALQASVDDARFYFWRPNDSDNPYLGCLALADVLMVTSDSESMLADALATGTAVHIYPLPEQRRGLRHRVREWASRCVHDPAKSWRHALGARLVDLGLLRTARNLGALHQSLIETGHAHPFGAQLVAHPHPPLREMHHVVERVRALFTGSSSFQSLLPQ